MVDRIKSAVNSALAAKGWTEVPSGGDVEVFAIETTQNQQTLDTFYNGFGGGRRWGFAADWRRHHDRRDLQSGNLGSRSLRCKTEKVIWRSSSSDTLSDKPTRTPRTSTKA